MSHQMLDLYEQDRASQGTKVEGSTGTGSGLPQTNYHNQGPSQASLKVPFSSEKPKASIIGLSHERRQNHEEDGRDHRMAKDPQHHGDHQAQRGHIPRTGGWYEQNRVQGGHIPRMRGCYEHNWAQRGHIPRTRGWYEQNRASQETKGQGSTGTGCSLPQTNYHNQSPSQASAKVLVSSEEPKAAKVLVSSEEPKAAKVPVSSKKPKASTIGSPHQQRQNHEEDGRDHQMATDPQHHGDH
ncbi:hypothetical protein AMTR_s00012p00236230 [Amborella trichopoda]|uniref:Uncharacterized protein n=1 Tax=Amborella trichopoda TaxID=13333 RepID=W1PL98_AMBTC|nr:hypothetical protein AMTR_s00012p00236230 [Amborella trichopoda]